MCECAEEFILKRFLDMVRAYVAANGFRGYKDWHKKTLNVRSKIDPELFAFAERRLRGEILPTDDERWDRSEKRRDDDFEVFSNKIIMGKDQNSPRFRAVNYQDDDTESANENQDVITELPSDADPEELDFSIPDLRRKARLLIDLIGEADLPDWAEISEAIGKTQTECMEWYRAITDLPLSSIDRKRTTWTDEEDRTLLNFMPGESFQHWIRVSHFVRHRPSLCQKRLQDLFAARKRNRGHQPSKDGIRKSPPVSRVTRSSRKRSNLSLSKGL